MQRQYLIWVLNLDGFLSHDSDGNWQTTVHMSFATVYTSLALAMDAAASAKLRFSNIILMEILQ